MDRSHNLFRKKALDHLATPEAFSNSIQVVSLKFWIVLATLWSILFGILIWSIFGTIPTRIHGDGILLVQGGAIHGVDATHTEGEIIALNVTPTQIVKRGDVIAVIKNTNLEKEVLVAKQHLLALKKQYGNYQKAAKKNIATHQGQVQQQETLLKNTIQAEVEHLSYTKKLLDDQLIALKKGIEYRTNILPTHQNYFATQREIARAQQQIHQNQINHTDVVDRWSQRLRDLELKIEDAQSALNKLQEQLTLSTQIKTPIDGSIISIDASLGDRIEKGETIATIARLGEGLDAILFIQPKDGKRVKVDMQALITPDTIKREEFGSIRGEVIEVAHYPATQSAMLALLHNEALVKHFSKAFSPIVVRVRLRPKASTFSGYDWTSSEGPQQAITAGTLINGQIVVRKQAPITLLIPTLKKILGLKG